MCHTPMVLHIQEDTTYYMCHSCGRQESAEMTCTQCHGWRLKALGVGIQRALKDIRDRHPDVTIFQLDSDTAPTPPKAREIVKKFLATPGSILLGTEMLVHYLNQPIENAAVFSVDSLFTIPDYKINEKVFHLLLSLRLRAQKIFCIQTRNPDQPVFSYIFQGNLLDFHREEIAARRKFAYPPFATCIKLTVGGKKGSVETELAKAEQLLAEYEPIRYPSFIEEKRGVYREHILLRLKPEVWIDEKLLAILRSLPPFFDIAVDPDSLL
jgi:primosomal protein N' (replication factor Y)